MGEGMGDSDIGRGGGVWLLGSNGAVQVGGGSGGGGGGHWHKRKVERLGEVFCSLQKLRLRNRADRTLALKNFCITHLIKEDIIKKFCTTLNKMTFLLDFD